MQECNVTTIRTYIMQHSFFAEYCQLLYNYTYIHIILQVNLNFKKVNKDPEKTT